MFRYLRLAAALLLPWAAAGAANCTFTITPASISITALGGAGQFDLTASSSDCTRTALSAVDWITISFGQTGSGNGSVGYMVKANTTSQVRQGSILINSQAFTINQEAAKCDFLLTPASESVPASGGAFSIRVATSCTWTATAGDPWIAITQPAAATGNGAFSFTVAANSGASARSGSIAIGPAVFPISQAGAVCTIALSAQGVSVSSAAQNGTFSVTANAGCTVSALPDVPWITAVVNMTTVSYSVSANPSGQSRSGNILVGGQKFTITQAGVACTFTLSPAMIVIPASGGAGKIAIATADGCAWTVQNQIAFVVNITPASGTGSGSITVNVGPQTSGSGRTGILLVAGTQVTVSQAAGAIGGIRVFPLGIVNGASFSGDAVSPGEILSIFGSSLGPDPANTNAPFFPTSLAGTRVLFDDTPAPVIFTSAGQVSAIVPYALARSSTTQVRVEYRGNLSDPVPIAVATSSPAIFTLAATGKGQGAILNQDFSVNGPANPAAVGSIVMIYATGEGETNPPGIDGKLTGVGLGDVLPRPTQAIAVQIGGIDAEVLYAGGAPGLVAGLLQVNVRVPAGIAGNATPVVLRAGNAVSPAGVTVAVQ
ncbi:MAG: hypothetical protein M3Z23_10725 [Acidobacteriota bacterium]|nr:hypothetical protein [Acidobacteriota bacterium]